MMAAGKKGVWRTICGRKVFIAEGQTLTEAMKASGKFSKVDIATSEKNGVSRKKDSDLKTSTGKIGRTVAIERVGADKMTYRDNINKLRVYPALADLIKAGEFDHIAKGENEPNKKFEEFAYYKIRVKLDDEIYVGMLNVGIRKDGSSTLYDLRPFQKESKKEK